jgi:hypothetical protein
MIIENLKVYKVLFLIILVASAIGCSPDKQLKSGLPSIDVRKDYPEKEILLTDIADITYVHLNSQNYDYVYRGGVKYITENSIVVVDISSGSVLFFSKDGTPKSRFNHYGQGPEEYSSPNFSIVYDEKEDDLYVIDGGFFINKSHPTRVYSSTGEYKRTLFLPAEPMPLVDFDDHSLFVYDMQNVNNKLYKEESDLSSQLMDSSIYRISKKNGKVLEYVEFPINTVDIIRSDKFKFINFYESRIKNCAAGLFLCLPETDTVFLYGKDKSLTPVICKTPLVSDLNPILVLGGFVDAGDYQYITVEPTISDLFEKGFSEELQKSLVNHYIRNKKTDEIFRQKISLPDYKGKDFFIESHSTYFTGKETLACFSLDIYELKQAEKENRLSGKLKEFVSTLNENEDNNVYVLATFN